MEHERIAEKGAFDGMVVRTVDGQVRRALLILGGEADCVCLVVEPHLPDEPEEAGSQDHAVLDGIGIPGVIWHDGKQDVLEGQFPDRQGIGNADPGGTLSGRPQDFGLGSDGTDAMAPGKRLRSQVEERRPVVQGETFFHAANPSGNLDLAAEQVAAFGKDGIRIKGNGDVVVGPDKLPCGKLRQNLVERPALFGAVVLVGVETIGLIVSVQQGDRLDLPGKPFPRLRGEFVFLQQILVNGDAFRETPLIEV